MKVRGIMGATQNSNTAVFKLGPGDTQRVQEAYDFIMDVITLYYYLLLITHNFFN